MGEELLAKSTFLFKLKIHKLAKKMQANKCSSR